MAPDCKCQIWISYLPLVDTEFGFAFRKNQTDAWMRRERCRCYSTRHFKRNRLTIVHASLLLTKSTMTLYGDHETLRKQRSGKICSADTQTTCSSSVYFHMQLVQWLNLPSHLNWGRAWPQSLGFEMTGDMNAKRHTSLWPCFSKCQKCPYFWTLWGINCQVCLHFLLESSTEREGP